MAKQASSRTGTKTGSSARKTGSSATKTGKSVARVKSSAKAESGSFDGMGDAFIKLLQSPLVAELVAVAATAALAALAEHGFSSSEGPRSKRAGGAVKAAGKAAAAAIGRRLSNEIQEIRSAAKTAKDGAAA